MLTKTNLYEEAERRLAELIKIIETKEDSLTKAPEGKIHIVKTKDRVQFYLRKLPSDKTGRYLSKTELNKIKAYVQKSYDERTLKLLKQEASNLGKFLAASGRYSNKLPLIYSDKPQDVKELIAPVDVTDEDYVTMWLSNTYEGKELGDNIPFYETVNKERVRSKSELTIANTLARYGIPYKYECPLVLGKGMVIYPDFTILNVKNRKEIYWEHRGMMDDMDYARHSVMRIKSYAKEEIQLGINLIITEETSQNPLGTDEIENVIRNYLL